METARETESGHSGQGALVTMVIKSSKKRLPESSAHQTKQDNAAGGQGGEG